MSSSIWAWRRTSGVLPWYVLSFLCQAEDVEDIFCTSSTFSVISFFAERRTLIYPSLYGRHLYYSPLHLTLHVSNLGVLFPVLNLFPCVFK